MSKETPATFLKKLAIITQDGNIHWDVSSSEISLRGDGVKILCKWNYQASDRTFFTVYQNSEKASVVTRIGLHDYPESEPIGTASDSNELRDVLEEDFPFDETDISSDEINELINNAFEDIVKGENQT